MSEGGDLTEGDGRGEEGRNTSMDMIYMHKLINANHCAEHGKEEGIGWELGEG